MTTVDIAQSPPTGEQPAVTLPDQAGRLLGHAAGYIAHRVVAIGLRTGLVRALAEAGEPVSADELAERLGLDPYYVAVWCRAAHAGGLCERPQGEPLTEPAGLDGRYQLAPHAATLLLDAGHPGYVGGLFTVLEQDEIFGRFERSLATGERLWWDGCSPDWIDGVAATGLPFYTRLVPAGLTQVPELGTQLAAGCRVVDIACGSGAGLVRLATAFPDCIVVGVDGDQRSIQQAGRRLEAAGLRERCVLVHSPLEEFALDEPATCVINNISMHECRDIDRVTENVRAALRPGGWFVISDFPFPETVDGLRTVPGRLMAGIQLFEAQIDDQLLPRGTYDELLRRHGFTELGNVQLSPVHAVTYGRAPA
ncbi:MAG TPA: class I SAM-dependent methyltransferase [Jatrophihabitantaceae bacterium]|nr:class I SAM-dependent methyltransferase [Jatrophihabitantaceae bacterium]